MAPIPRSPDGVAMKLWRERNVQASPAETTRSRAAVQRDGKPEMQTSRKKKGGPSTAAPPLRSHQRTCNRGRHTPPRPPADPCRPPLGSHVRPVHRYLLRPTLLPFRPRRPLNLAAAGPRTTQSPGSLGRFSAPAAAIGYGASATPRRPLERVYGMRLGPAGHSAWCPEITSNPMWMHWDFGRSLYRHS